MSGETFTWRMPLLGADTDPHAIGDLGCRECCCDLPEPCDECGGVLHGQVDDEVQVGDDWEWQHSRRCDRPCPCVYCPADTP